MCAQLAQRGPEKVVVSGLVLDENTLGNFIYERGKAPQMLTREKIGPYRSGTGDVFASVVSAAFVRGFPLERAVRLASSFVRDCIRKSEELEIPVENGVCFEELMDRLTRIR